MRTHHTEQADEFTERYRALAATESATESDCQSLSPAPCEVEQSTSQTIALWRVPRCGGRGCERNPSPFAKCTHLCCAAGNAGNQYEGYERLKKDCNCLEKNLKYRYTDMIWLGHVESLLLHIATSEIWMCLPQTRDSLGFNKPLVLAIPGALIWQLKVVRLARRI